MRKSQILLAIEKELEKANLSNKKLLEIKLNAKDQSKNKDRLAYCILKEDSHTKDQIENILNIKNINDYFELKLTEFDSIKSVKHAHLQTLNDAVQVENNWRGRLFHFEHLITVKNSEEAIADFILRSVWRIIIQRDNEFNYYIRHDIFPFFWSPGHSTGSSKDYLESVEHEFWNVSEPKFHRQDDDFDVIKVFAQKLNSGNQYYQVSFSPPNTSETDNISEVNFKMSHTEKESCLKNLKENLVIYFTD